MKNFKYTISRLFIFAGAIFLGIIFYTGSAHAISYDPSNLISDDVFTNYHTMTAGDIQTFLNNENSGIRNLTDVENCSPPTPTPPYSFTYYPHCGQSESAATIIYDAAQAYGVNPQAILATMQKEESLITDPSPTQSQIDCAMGYNSCGTYVGFFSQVDNGTWQLRTYIELMDGRNWWGYTPPQYPCSTAGYIQAYNSNGQKVSMRVYSTGLYPGTNVTFDNPTVYSYSNGSWQISGGKNPPVPETFTLASSATAALYCYTPYVGPYSTTGYSGSYNFVNWFETWFGSTIFSPSSITMTQTQPRATPALGEKITYNVNLKNNLSDSVTLTAGVVGRLGSIAGANRDLGWQTVTISGGATANLSFPATIQDLGTLYLWPAIYYEGLYYHYNNWGEMLTTHIPNLGATISRNVASPITGQTDTLSTTISNYEGHDIAVDAMGIPARFYGRYNYDVTWAAGQTISAGTSSPTISGPMYYDKLGPYSQWISVKIGSYYVAVSPTSIINVSQGPTVSSIGLSAQSLTSTTPAVGSTETYTFSLKNNSGAPITLSSVGVVGRYDNPYTGSNADFGWAGPSSSPTNTTFAAGETKTYSFSTTINSTHTLYAWVAFSYQYNTYYVHYNNWGFMIIPHS